jgi:hypothetical protein
LLSTAAGGDAADVGQIWVAPSAPAQPPPGPRAQFGDRVHLLGLRHDAEAEEVVLYWRADSAVDLPASIFVHFLDGDGRLLGQADGLPYANAYAVTDWRPGQIIEDRRSLAGLEAGDPPRRVAVGLYDPATGVRWPAVDAQARPLPDDALVFDLAAAPPP